MLDQGMPVGPAPHHPHGEHSEHPTLGLALVIMGFKRFPWRQNRVLPNSLPPGFAFPTEGSQAISGKSWRRLSKFRLHRKEFSEPSLLLSPLPPPTPHPPLFCPVALHSLPPCTDMSFAQARTLLLIFPDPPWNLTLHHSPPTPTPTPASCRKE